MCCLYSPGPSEERLERGAGDHQNMDLLHITIIAHNYLQIMYYAISTLVVVGIICTLPREFCFLNKERAARNLIAKALEA